MFSFTLAILKVRGPGNKEVRTTSNHEVVSDRINSTTVELIHLLRQQQASHRPMQAGESTALSCLCILLYIKSFVQGLELLYLFTSYNMGEHDHALV